jgi:predicted transport protein
LLVLEQLGAADADAIDWRNPRLICVASGYTRYDEYAVQQINRSIELVRYRDFEGELLAFELITTTGVEPTSAEGAPAPRRAGRPAVAEKTVTEYLDQAPDSLRDLYFELERFCEGLGDDVTKKVLKFYFAFRRLKNFACVEVHPQKKTLLIYVKVSPDDVELKSGFSRDVRSIGHFGTGDLELRITSRADLEDAFPLIQRSYEAS